MNTYTISRVPRTGTDRLADRWVWTVTLGAGQTDTIAAWYDGENNWIVVERNDELIGCYEGQRKAASIARAAKCAIIEVYG